MSALVLLTCLSAISPVQAQSAKKKLNLIENISYSSGPKSENLIISLQREVSYRARFLNNNPKKNRPYRLFVDLISTKLRPKIKPPGLPKGSIIKQIRTAQRQNATARIVLDIKRKIYREDYKISQSIDPPAITIEFLKKDKTHPGATTKKTKKSSASAQAETSLPGKYLQKKTVKNASVCTVVIDPGHGGKDPGAIGYKGIKEKDVCLSLGRALKKQINEKKGYKAVLTRDSDVFLSLDERGALANKYNADIFISLHSNSHEDSRLTGIETYYLSFASDEAARKVAARENFTTTSQISDLEMIFFDLLQNNKINQSSILAGYVHNSMVKKISNKYRKKVRNLGIKHAPMRVLINTEMPCILIETAFISNPKEAKQLKTSTYQKSLASAIFNGIENFRSAHKTAFNKTAP